VALAWQCYVALVRRGKDPGAFVTTIARRAAQAALAGRRVCGAERIRDALSPRARLQDRVRVERLGDRRVIDWGRRPGEAMV